MFQQAIISALAHQQRVRWQHPTGAHRPMPATRGEVASRLLGHRDGALRARVDRELGRSLVPARHVSGLSALGAEALVVTAEQVGRDDVAASMPRAGIGIDGDPHDVPFAARHRNGSASRPSCQPCSTSGSVASIS